MSQYQDRSRSRIRLRLRQSPVLTDFGSGSDKFGTGPYSFGAGHRLGPVLYGSCSGSGLFGAGSDFFMYSIVFNAEIAEMNSVISPVSEPVPGPKIDSGAERCRTVPYCSGSGSD